MPAPSAAADQARQRLARHHRAGRIGGAADQHALQRCLAMRSQQGFAGQRVAGVARGLDQHRLAAERGQDMAIGRIAGHGDRHPVARLEHRKERQDETAGRARRDHDPLGVYGTAISIAVVPGDPRAKRGNAERGGVVDPSLIEGRVGGRDRRFRRRRCRLPDFHVNDMPAGRLDPRRRRHHVHHHERWNFAPPRGRQQVLRAVSECRIEHGYLLSGGRRRFGVSGTGCRPRLAAFGGLLGHIAWSASQANHQKTTSCCSASRYDKKTCRDLTALVTALALGDCADCRRWRSRTRVRRSCATPRSEQLLRDYTRPILRAAGLEKQNIQMVIINESAFNAFVADGRRIFVNYGAMMQSETPNQIIGVLAHETGHLAGGHLSKLREQLAQAQTQMIIAMLLGAGAMVAGARSGGRNSGLTNAGAAAIAAPQEMIRRTLLSYQRQQEENADRAGVKFLTATGQSAKGMYETFKRFTDESLFAARGADPYVQSHPMPVERVARAGGDSRAPAPIGTRRTIRRCSCATTWCAPRSPPSWSGRTPSTGAIRCPTPACPRAMRTPSPPICTAICATRWRRSTP